MWPAPRRWWVTLAHLQGTLPAAARRVHSATTHLVPPALGGPRTARSSLHLRLPRACQGGRPPRLRERTPHASCPPAAGGGAIGPRRTAAPARPRCATCWGCSPSPVPGSSTVAAHLSGAPSQTLLSAAHQNPRPLPRRAAGGGGGARPCGRRPQAEGQGGVARHQGDHARHQGEGAADVCADCGWQRGCCWVLPHGNIRALKRRCCHTQEHRAEFGTDVALGGYRSQMGKR